MTRTINLENALDDAIVAYGQNGEMLRPENGYPLRLVVPGVQGVSWVKWLRRLEVGDRPWAAKDEASHYVDLMPDGSHRQYTSIQEAKSVITAPSGGQKLLKQGYYCITGLAWSGRGSVSKVEVSVDGGRNWRVARLEGPVLPKALTRLILTGLGVVKRRYCKAASRIPRAIPSPRALSWSRYAVRGRFITTTRSRPGG